MGAPNFAPQNNSSQREKSEHEGSSNKKLNDVLRSLQHILQLDAFRQNRSLRKIVSDRNGRQNKHQNASDHKQTSTKSRHYSGVRTAAPDSPGQHGATGDQEANEIEREFHSEKSRPQRDGSLKSTSFLQVTCSPLEQCGRTHPSNGAMGRAPSSWRS